MSCKFYDFIFRRAVNHAGYTQMAYGGLFLLSILEEKEKDDSFDLSGRKNTVYQINFRRCISNKIRLHKI